MLESIRSFQAVQVNELRESMLAMTAEQLRDEMIIARSIIAGADGIKGGERFVQEYKARLEVARTLLNE